MSAGDRRMAPSGKTLSRTAVTGEGVRANGLPRRVLALAEARIAAAAAVGVVAGVAIGSMMTQARAQQQAQASGCSLTRIVVNGITYAQCGSTWYQPVYQGGQVAHQVVSPPR
jgi:hypothetical protein